MEMIYIKKGQDAEWTAIAEVMCTHCKSNIEDQGIVMEIHNTRNPKHHQFIGFFFFHNECVKEHRNYTFAGSNGRQVQTKPLKVLPFEPEDLEYNYEVYIPKHLPLQYASNNATVFEPHLLPKSEQEDKDMTRLAGRETWEGATIGNTDYALLEEKESELNEDDSLKLLQDIKNYTEQALIEEQERGFIDYNPHTSDLTIEEDEKRQAEESNNGN